MEIRRKFRKIIHFWLMPFLSGAFLATGYVVTNGILISPSQSDQSKKLFLQTGQNIPKAINPSQKKSLHEPVQSSEFSAVKKNKQELRKLSSSNHDLNLKPEATSNSLELIRQDLSSEETILKKDQESNAQINPGNKEDSSPLSKAKAQERKIIKALFQSLPEP